MYRIALVNMPLADLAMPSLALIQLEAAVKKELPGQVELGLYHLNHDFAHYAGKEGWDELYSFEHHPAGLGEWFFRQAAFPEQPDNTDEYFQRYFPHSTPRSREIRRMVEEKRAGLVAHLHAMIDRYGLDRVDMVGLTSMFSQNVACLAMARLVKERNPKAVVVMGGANCEGPMGRELVEHAMNVDFVFSGPSLKSFPRLVRCLMEGDEEGCHRIDGVFSRRNQVNGSGCGRTGLVTLGGRPSVRMFGEENDINELVDFDYVPFLDRYEAYFPDGIQPALLFETSRGCWWGERAHCTFCGLNGSTIAYRSMRPEVAFRLFNDLFQHADRVSEIKSVDNILPRDFLTDVLPYLDTPPNVSLFYEVKADLTEEDFQVLAKARALRIQPGIEALNTSTLKLMRKGTSVFQNLSFLINAARYGIEPVWNLLIGFPGEEITVYEKYLEELPLLTHLFPPNGAYPIRFDRFSPYYDEADAYGLELQPLDWYELTYPFPREALANLAYYFSDVNYAAPYAQNAARMVGRLREKIERWKELWKSGTPPQLRVEQRGGIAYVFDSRSGTPREYAIREEERLVLEGLATAKKLANLQKELPEVDVEFEVAALMDRGLLFNEGERYMSLVVRPPRPYAFPLPSTDFAAAAAATA